jgi:gluconolactonase
VIDQLAQTDAHEGPVVVEGALYFTTVPRGGRVDIRRLDLDSGRITTVRADANMANGMTLDAGGHLLVCEQGSRSRPARIARLDPATGGTETVIEAYRGAPLNSPNDVVVTRDGAIWFTDPSYGHVQGFRPEPELPDRVYRYDGELTPVADGFEKPNGLAFSPDEDVLYVGDSEARHVKAFTAHGERVFCEIASGYPDGIVVDGDGNVLTTASTGVQVFAPSGDLIGEIPLPGAVNLTLDRDVLYVTADTAIWAVDRSQPWPSSAPAGSSTTPAPPPCSTPPSRPRTASAS